MLERSGSFEFARERMHSLVYEALAAMEGLPEATSTGRLRELAQFIVKPEK